ncbi:MAG: hypothetical protein LQ338_006815 [Usnochroma carphineum]|nr:MAG: hypothetical protein LQ338_006815 [Usnochroma carphineum]
MGRPLSVSIDPESHILRVGSRIMKGSSGGSFEPIRGLEEGYVEDVASQGRYVATTTRRHLTIDDINSSGRQEEIPDGLVKKFNKLLEDTETSQAGSGETTTDTLPSSLTRSTSDEDHQRRQISANSSMTSLDIGSLPSDVGANSSEDDEKSNGSISLDNVTDDSYDSNSARESWSEASTDPASDEVEDDDLWNESDDSDSDSAIGEDLRSEIESDDGSLKVDDQEQETESGSAVSENKDGNEENEEDQLKRLVEGSDEDSASDLDADTSGYSSDEDDESGDTSGDSDAAQEKLEKLVLGKHRLSKSASRLQRGSIQIYQLDQSQAARVFHFSIDLSHFLFESPAVFHPSAPLVVWPLHRGEILFADFSRKTYFTRTLRPSKPNSCHVFIKSCFSSDGRYLHIAALEARPEDKDPARPATDDPDDKARLQLILQISTHRLSAHKPTRAPPRLVYRTKVSFTPVASIPASRLPYTLTWTSEHVYLTTSDRKLNVIRIPLFRHRRCGSDQPETEQGSRAQVPVNTIHLPESASQRQVHYFPPNTSRGNRGDCAHVCISARSPATDMVVSDSQASPPVGVVLHEERDLGGWRYYEGPEGAEGVEGDEDEKGGGGGGMLQGKWEKFDRVADCDIVPYLY